MRTYDMPTRTLAPVLHYLRRIERPDSDDELLARFVRTGDEGAFAVLLGRYSPMVFGICRRVLRDRHEAEDAFQATFLLLVRKAASLRRPELLGNWLHGVAYRTALKARSRALRRAADALVSDVPAPAADDALWRDLRPVLDRAIDALPAKYRVPFVLCHLQGLTNRQAAQQLGCPEGTVATRLSRARERLRSRLARHGLGGAASAAVLGVGANALSAAVPSLLFVSTLRIAIACRLGTMAVPAAVAALTEGVGQAMRITNLHFILALIALVGTAVGGTALWALGGQDRPRPVQAAPPGVVEPPLAPIAPAPIAPAPIPPAPAHPVVGMPESSAVVRTSNFTVHAPSRRIAQLIGDAAERLRRGQAILWLGKELPTWTELCTVNVHLDVADFGNSTTFQFTNGKVVGRRMSLVGPLDQVLSSFLPHEITHTVLADHFGAPIPRWADEGAALQAVDVEEQQHHEAHMRELAGQPKRVVALPDLFRMRDYPKDLQALHAESYSLTHFLLQRKDRKTFLAFVAQGMQSDGWDAAVKDHYGFDDVAALKEAWFAGVVKDRAMELTKTAAQKAVVVKSAAPTVGRASIDAEGRLVLRTPIAYYQPVTRYERARGTTIPWTSYELKIVERMMRYSSVQDVTATDLAGKPIDAKTLAGRLQTDTPVLIGPAGQTVDPYYLSVVREGTIILTPRQDVEPPMPPPTAPVR
jgi:RNA polymerase sigma factor (sigma-70 family)